MKKTFRGDVTYQALALAALREPEADVHRLVLADWIDENIPKNWSAAAGLRDKGRWGNVQCVHAGMWWWPDTKDYDGFMVGDWILMRNAKVICIQPVYRWSKQEPCKSTVQLRRDKSRWICHDCLCLEKLYERVLDLATDPDEDDPRSIIERFPFIEQAIVRDVRRRHGSSLDQEET